MMSAESLARIDASTGWRTHRVEVFDLPEGQVLVKGQRPSRSRWPHRLLNALAWLAGVPFMKAVPVHGGGRSQAIEVERLRTLFDAGLPVPQVLHVAPDHFVMRYLGERHLWHVLREQGSEAWPLWMQAMEAILLVHTRGQYLSQCFARNIIVADRFRGLIDFEDDPLEVMSLAQAQARDWLIFLQSTLWPLGADPQRLEAALHQVLDRESEPVRSALSHVARRLGWMRWLPTNRQVWGRDFVSLQAVGAALYRHHHHNPRFQAPSAQPGDP